MPPVIYKDHRGNRLPSVTTIIGRFKESGGLLYWANQQGLEGKTLDQARAEVTTPGTLAHKAVEDHINGRPETALTGAGEVTEKARNAYAAYLHWEAMNKITFRHTEVALASEQHAFGGTLDAVGMIGNELILLDWKCANAVYADYLYSSPPMGCSGTRIIPTTRRWVVSICAASPKSRAISPTTISHHSTTRPKPSC